MITPDIYSPPSASEFTQEPRNKQVMEHQLDAMLRLPEAPCANPNGGCVRCSIVLQWRTGVHCLGRLWGVLASDKAHVTVCSQALVGVHAVHELGAQHCLSKLHLLLHSPSRTVLCDCVGAAGVARNSPYWEQSPSSQVSPLHLSRVSDRSIAMVVHACCQGLTY